MRYRRIKGYVRRARDNWWNGLDRAFHFSGGRPSPSTFQSPARVRDQTDKSSSDPRGNVRDGGPPSDGPPPPGKASGMGDSGAVDWELPWGVPDDGLTARTART
jgi:hypothetical protein